MEASMEKNESENRSILDHTDIEENCLSEDHIVAIIRDLIRDNVRVKSIWKYSRISREMQEEFLDDFSQEILLRLIQKVGVITRNPEISQAWLTERVRSVELPGFLNELLKKQSPERFRLSSRIWKIVRSHGDFVIDDLTPVGRSSRRGDAWVRYAPMLSPCDLTSGPTLEHLKILIPKREFRRIGRKGISQLIIGNRSLELFLKQIVIANGGRIRFSELKSIALSGIQIFDPTFKQIGESEEDRLSCDFRKESNDPLGQLLFSEGVRLLPDQERRLLRRIEAESQKGRQPLAVTLEIFWHFILREHPLSKSEISKLMGLKYSVVIKTVRFLEKSCRSLKLEERKLLVLFRDRLRVTVGNLLKDNRRVNGTDLFSR